MKELTIIPDEFWSGFRTLVRPTNEPYSAQVEREIWAVIDPFIEVLAQFISNPQTKPLLDQAVKLVMAKRLSDSLEKVI